MRTLRILFALVAVFGLVAIVAACGGDDGESNEQVAGTPTATATARATRTPMATPSPTATPTATPTPFDGEVALLILPSLDVVSEIENIGLTPNNQLQTPEDARKTGWYGIYDRPGWGGNSVFSAHVDYYPDIKGPFNKLTEMEPGDEVVVEMANGDRYVYEVFENTRYHVDTIPMGDIIWPGDRPEGEEWITLITCGGTFQPYSGDSGPGQYLHRDVVVAKRVQ